MSSIDEQTRKAVTNMADALESLAKVLRFTATRPIDPMAADRVKQAAGQASALLMDTVALVAAAGFRQAFYEAMTNAQKDIPQA